MKEIKVSKLKENFINIISKEWMLVTAGTEEKFNTMTASWGGTGFLWNRPVVFVFVRPERYTYQFIEEQDFFTLSFLGEDNKHIHKICGSKSGRDIDKIKEAGLKPIVISSHAITFEQSRLTLECKKLYTDMIKEDQFSQQGVFEQWYGEKHGSPHRIYIAEITNILVNE